MSFRNKHFPFTFLIAVVSWLVWFSVLLTISPEDQTRLFSIPLSFVVFFTPLLLAIFLTSTLLLGHTRRGFFITLGVFCLLILRLFKITNFLTIGFLIASIVVFELYFSKSEGV